jgi:hypothetical protein
MPKTNYNPPVVGVLIKYALKQHLSSAEQELLSEWCNRSEEHWRLPDQLRDPEWLEENAAVIKAAPPAWIWAEIRAYLDTRNGIEITRVPELGRWGWAKQKFLSVIRKIIG